MILSFSSSLRIQAILRLKIKSSHDSNLLLHLISSFGYLSSLFLPPFEERFLSSKSGSNCFQPLSLVSLIINDRLFKLPFLKISHFFVHPQHQFLSSFHPLPLPGIQALQKIPPNASHFDPIVNELLLILQWWGCKFQMYQCMYQLYQCMYQTYQCMYQTYQCRNQMFKNRTNVEQKYSWYLPLALRAARTQVSKRLATEESKVMTWGVKLIHKTDG